MPAHDQPPEILTYSLRAGKANSDRYYRDVAAFADEVLSEANRHIGDLIAVYRVSLGSEADQIAVPETVFELLTLGVLWRTYGSVAQKLRDAPQRVLSTLVRIKQLSGPFESFVDAVRGWLGSFFLYPDDGSPSQVRLPDLAQVDRLLDWLEATGDFEQACKRLRHWQAFLSGQPASSVSGYLEGVDAFAAWFDRRSLEVLGKYTPNVEAFLARIRLRSRWREDAIFCSRKRLEYHLNMLGTELLNRSFRPAFARASHKVLLVPPCMKAQPDDVCKAVETPFGARCAACTPGCRIHQLTRLGEKHGFDVFMLPDDLASLKRAHRQRGVSLDQASTDGDIAVVGVSCALTNAPGGWQTRHLGIPAQGMLLDYCGCKYHWHPQGFPTDVNIQQALRVLSQGDTKHELHE
jgi:hypothetical protein